MSRYKTLFILFSLVIVSLSSSASVTPSLFKDCDFKDFQDRRMIDERKKFWTITPDQECHNKRAEHQYDAILAKQIASCYHRFTNSEFKLCDLFKYALDPYKANRVVADSEYYNWRLSEKLGEDIVFPAKYSYMQAMSRWITGCFTETDLTNVHDEDTVVRLFTIVETLSLTRRSNSENPLLEHAWVSHGHRGRGDGQTKYEIHFNGLVLTSINDDGDVTVTLEREK